MYMCFLFPLFHIKDGLPSYKDYENDNLIIFPSSQDCFATGNFDSVTNPFPKPNDFFTLQKICSLLFFSLLYPLYSFDTSVVSIFDIDI